MKIHNQTTVLSNCQVYQDTTYSAHNTPEQRYPDTQDAESSLQKFSLETRLRESETVKTCTKNTECCGETSKSQESAGNSEQEHHDKGENTETILSPDCRWKKSSSQKYKQNIPMTDCLQTRYSKTSQSVIPIFFLNVW